MGACGEKYRSYIALICVTATEMGAVMQMYPWEIVKIAGDDQIYYRASFLRNGKTCTVIAAKQDEMGMTASAVLSMKLIEQFRPQYLIMVGIAAGVALPDVEEQLYGDVILPDVVWNYSAGKYVSGDKAVVRLGDVGFIPRPTVLKMEEWLRPYIMEAVNSPENEAHIYIGPMASGTSVVANTEILSKFIRHSMHETAGLDMEAYAIVYAAKHASAPRPTPIIAKSVCDFADSRKSDQYQKFAAFTSCEFAKFLYERFLPLEKPEEAR